MADKLHAPRDVTCTEGDSRFPDGTLTLIDADGYCLVASGGEVPEAERANVEAAIANQAQHEKIASDFKMVQAAGVLSREAEAAISKFSAVPEVQKAAAALHKALQKASGLAEPVGG